MQFPATEQRLIEWATWARAGSSLGYKSPSLIVMIQNVGSSVPSLPVSDESAERVDQVVARLRRSQEDMGVIIILYYLERYSDVRISRALSISRHRVSKLRESAVAWIDGAIN